MKYFGFLLAIFSIISLQSCQIDAVTHFNKDYSGTSSTTIDLSQLIDFASSFGEEDGDADMESLDSIFMMFDGSVENDSIRMFMDSLKTVFHDAGMKNFNFSKDGDYGLKASFDFDNLDVFDGQDLMSKIGESLSGSDMGDEIGDDMFGSMPAQSTISRNGKWMIIDLFGMSYDEFKEQMVAEMKAEQEALGEEVDEEEMDIESTVDMALGMMGMMGDMYEFNSTYSFDRKVKDVECPLPFTSDKHSVTISYSLSDVLESLKEEGSVQLRIKLK